MIFDMQRNNIAMLMGAASVAIMLLGCGGSGGGSSSEAGIGVEILAQPQPTPNADNSITALPAGRKEFDNNEGMRIAITRAYLVIGSVVLENNCDSSAFARIDLQALPRAIVNLLIPSAQAHTSATPTQTGEPNVINLLAADLAGVDIGDLAPSADDYCGITVNMSAADEDAVGLPEDVDMIGKTLHIEGSASIGSLAPDIALPFVIETTVALLPASIAFDEALTLDSSHRNAAVTLQINYQRWFDGVDFISIDDVPQQELILNNIRESLTAIIE
jgi:hypothetical protein